MLFKMTKRASPGLDFKIEFQDDATDYQKLSNIFSPDTLYLAQMVIKYQTNYMFEKIDESLNIAGLMQKSEAALARLPINTDRKQGKSL